MLILKADKQKHTEDR